MPTDKTNDRQSLSYTKKVWIAGGILSLIVIFLLLFKTLFSVVLLVFAGIMIAVFFHGFAAVLHRNVHTGPKLSVVLSVVISLLLVIGFFWFAGARLQEQISQLSDTLPGTIQNAKDKLDESAVGRKVLDFLNSSGNSEKTRSVIKHFFLPVLVL